MLLALSGRQAERSELPFWVIAKHPPPTQNERPDSAVETERTCRDSDVSAPHRWLVVGRYQAGLAIPAWRALQDELESVRPTKLQRRRR